MANGLKAFSPTVSRLASSVAVSRWSVRWVWWAGHCSRSREEAGMAPRTTTTILGYEVPIRMGMWQRDKRYGAPKMWVYPWLLFCVWFVLLAFMRLGFYWACGVGGLWAVGQGVLVAL